MYMCKYCAPFNQTLRVLSTGGWGKVLPQNPHLPPPKKVLNNKRIYNIYNQLSDQTLDDIIDKYKYILLNESY